MMPRSSVTCSSSTSSSLRKKCIRVGTLVILGFCVIIAAKARALVSAPASDISLICVALVITMRRYFAPSSRLLESM